MGRIVRRRPFYSTEPRSFLKRAGRFIGNTGWRHLCYSFAEDLALRVDSQVASDSLLQEVVLDPVLDICTVFGVQICLLEQFVVALDRKELGALVLFLNRHLFKPDLLDRRNLCDIF